MTMLEAVIAFVLLSVVGVVCLDQSRGASQLQAQTAEWTRAVARAEAALAPYAMNAPFDEATDDARHGARADSAVRVERHVWQPGVDVVSVTVPLSDGRSYRLARLTAARP